MDETHYHVIPVDPSLTIDEAWREICLMGVRATYTGTEGWAVVECDGDECRNISVNMNNERTKGSR